MTYVTWRTIAIAAGVALSGFLLWRALLIGQCMRSTGWPRWAAAIEVDVGDWTDPGPSLRRIVGL